MFHTPAEAMAYSLKASHLFLHLLIDPLKPDDFDKQPIDGMNSISWVLGHLTLVDRRMLTWLEIADLPALPDGFEARFATTRAAATAQSGLGDPTAIVAQFDAHRRLLIDQLPTVDPALFALETAVKRPTFTDRGEATLFMGLHTSLHAGQISAIRRALGYPPLL
jgi:uncharacterized damage-inducible protein DinB